LLSGPQPRKETEPDQLGARGVLARQFFEGLVQRQQVAWRRFHGDFNVIEIDLMAVAITLQTMLLARPVDQDPPHCFRGGGEKMTARVPMPRLLCVHQPQIRLVNQGSGLECLARLFLGHFLGGQAAKLRVDKRQELLGRFRIAFLDGAENASDLVHMQPQIRMPAIRFTAVAALCRQCGWL
jgi:hypothetical protein